MSGSYSGSGSASYHQRMLADNGYYSAANVAACANTKIEPLIAMGHQPHHQPLGRALRNAAASAERRNAGRGHGASAEDPGGPGALRAAQADSGAGVWI